MNLWVKRIGQLLMVAVALIFLACQDETNVLGYKNPNSKFKVYSVELPIESSVLLIDSVRSSTGISSGDLDRLLVGKYSDPVFGEVTATAFSRFFPTTSTILPATAVLDSTTMELRFDYYAYGANDESKQSFSVHELTGNISFSDGNDYYTNSSVAFNSQPLGANSYSLNTTTFKDKFKETSKDTTIIHFTLNNTFGQRLFNVAQNNTDSALHKATVFIDKFKGVAVVPANNSKIAGFYPGGLSKITLHYHTDKDDSLKLNFSLSSGGFSRIVSDRSSSELSGLTSKYADSEPVLGKRYIQGATNVLTKIDLSKFYEFALADSNKNIAINGAELVIESIETPGIYPPPSQLTLLTLKNNNRFNFLSKNSTKEDSTEYINNNNKFLINTPTFKLFAVASYAQDVSSVSIVGDSRSLFTMDYKDNRYSGFMTMFAQQLYKQKNENIFGNFVLYPHNAPGGRSTDRVVFDKEKLKLKISYTRSTIN